MRKDFCLIILIDQCFLYEDYVVRPTQSTSILNLLKGILQDFSSCHNITLF
jgi:hypothetical protein